MKEPDRSSTFLFPGYHGPLPKALRSSRGRRVCQKKISQASGDLGCIELLATVAGEVLQAQNVQIVTQNGCVNSTGKEDGNIGSCQKDELTFQTCNLKNHPSPSRAVPQDMAHLQNAENVPCLVSRKVNVGSCNKEGESSFEDNAFPKGSGSKPVLTMPGYSNSHMHSEGHAESDANCSMFRDRDTREEGSCMSLLENNSPLPVSSGSDEEASTHLPRQLINQCREQLSEDHLDCRQDLDRLKARDDDDNFSNSVVPVTTLQQRPAVSVLPDGFQAPDPQCKSSREEVFIPVKKSKSKFTDGRREKKRFTSQEFKATKRHCAPETFKQIGDLNKSSSLQPRDLDAKDASVASSPTTTLKGSWKSAKRKSKDTHEPSAAVNVNITSFRVPELSINLPESATIANLKRAVMEAAVNLLGGGLHVRVLHHGKKVYDENSTLVQMGISCKERLESLAFMLEPNGVSNTSMDISESVFAYSTPRAQPATRYPNIGLTDEQDASKRQTLRKTSDIDAEAADTSKDSRLLEKSAMNDKERPELQHCLPCESLQPTGAALILHPGIEDKEPADIMVAQQDLGRLGGKRRTRRPFTVMEVEALVQAVELLGTGRWREVKQEVFSHARHRTYVDLKDKWKTLVHTARIAPQQRRGEPVPQELLDRVLQAHTYWAVQLAKQQEELGI